MEMCLVIFPIKATEADFKMKSVHLKTRTKKKGRLTKVIELAYQTKLLFIASFIQIWKPNQGLINSVSVFSKLGGL